MKNQLIFATHNTHKSREIAQLMPDYDILNLNDINFHEEIEEIGKTFHENAKIKVDAVSKKSNELIFADDSGLVIPALNGEPGIYSARFAGTGNSVDNIHKVLEKLKDSPDRSAYFICVICLKHAQGHTFFEGKVHGKILNEMRGSDGFGYDPVFQPNGYDISFAEMSAEAKNKISHRSLAIEKLKYYLSK